MELLPTDSSEADAPIPLPPLPALPSSPPSAAGDSALPARRSPAVRFQLTIDSPPQTPRNAAAPAARAELTSPTL